MSNFTDPSKKEPPASSIPPSASLGIRNPESLLFQGSRLGWWLQGSFMTLVIFAVWILWSNALDARHSKGGEHELAVIGEVGNFHLTNQFGRIITRDSLENQVWVADVFFSRCAGPCPRLSQKMAKLQSSIPSHWPVKLVSITSDPSFDGQEVLSHYARQFGCLPDRWHFLTGSKDQLHRLIVDSLKLVAVENNAHPQPGEDLFIHSTKLVLIDKQGRIRQYFDGLEADNEAAIIDAIRSLAPAE